MFGDFGGWWKGSGWLYGVGCACCFLGVDWLCLMDRVRLCTDEAMILVIVYLRFGSSLYC